MGTDIDASSTLPLPPYAFASVAHLPCGVTWDAVPELKPPLFGASMGTLAGPEEVLKKKVHILLLLLKTEKVPFGSRENPDLLSTIQSSFFPDYRRIFQSKEHCIRP